VSGQGVRHLVTATAASDRTSQDSCSSVSAALRAASEPHAARFQVLAVGCFARLRGRIPESGARRRAEEGPLGDLTPETRIGSALLDAPTIGSTVASRKRVPAPRCADPRSTLRRAPIGSDPRKPRGPSSAPRRAPRHRGRSRHKSQGKRQKGERTTQLLLPFALCLRFPPSVVTGVKSLIPRAAPSPVLA
jgi:hypothetical protein